MTKSINIQKKKLSIIWIEEARIIQKINNLNFDIALTFQEWSKHRLGDLKGFAYLILKRSSLTLMQFSNIFISISFSLYYVLRKSLAWKSHIDKYFSLFSRN